MNTNVLLCLLVISVSEVLSAPSLRGQCMVRPSLRIECGHSGITRYRCHKQGCCYDNSVRGAIACFESQSNITPLGQVPVATLRVVHDQATDDVFSPQPRVQNPDQSTMRTCSAAPLDRIECGWSSITRQACESRGCCFDRSSRGSPWCFKADSLLISQKMKTVLECAWECSRKSWRSIAAGYSKCATNAACWMMLVGQTPGACVAACKTTYEIGVFKSNVSTCLGLETTVARVASEQCDTDLPCWIDRFGYRALNCFRRYQATGQSFTIEYPETEEEMILPHEEVENTLAPSRAPPMIEREEESASTPEIEPEAPQETPQPPQGEGELIRTNLSVEISSSGITENRSSLDDVPSEEDTRIPEERIEEENS